MKWQLLQRFFHQRTMGARAESAAQKFLEKRGLVFQEKNFRTKAGEIDLIMRDGACLVFIEVRYRKSVKFGGAIESVDRHKQEKIIKAAQSFINKSDQNMRFDVVAFAKGNLKNPDWVRNAFSASW